MTGGAGAGKETCASGLGVSPVYVCASQLERMPGQIVQSESDDRCFTGGELIIVSVRSAHQGGDRTMRPPACLRATLTRPSHQLTLWRTNLPLYVCNRAASYPGRDTRSGSFFVFLPRLLRETDHPAGTLRCSRRFVVPEPSFPPHCSRVRLARHNVQQQRRSHDGIS